MLCARERLLFTLSYFGTMIATLYAAVVLRSFALTVVCSVAQFTTLLYYLGSFIPGGYRGVRLFLGAAGRTANLILRPLLGGCLKCCAALLR